MKRRDFVKQSTLGALGASWAAPLAAMAETPVTHLESDDVSPRAALADGFPLHFMAVGDWGRNGESFQLEVAKQMGDWATNNPNHFVISTGDNFYPKGVASVLDPLFHYSFENIYTAHALQCDWYPALGNHDHKSNVEAQVEYAKVSRRWNMSGTYYSWETPLGKGGGSVLFVIMDTDPLLSEEKAEYKARQLEWLEKTLKDASKDVKWKIVVGHHPAYTAGPRIKNYDTLKMRETFSPIFSANQVDLYLSGHEHSLQHLKADGFPHQFVSGAGSELTQVTTGLPYSRFQASEHGFMYFSVNQSTLQAKAISHTGAILYETQLKK